MGDVGETEEVAVLLVVAGVDGDGDVLCGVSVVGGVFGGGFGGWGFFVGGVGGQGAGEGQRCGNEKAGDGSVAVGSGEVRIHVGLIIIPDMTKVQVLSVAVVRA